MDKHIDERHRHRYEVNPTLVGQLESEGLRFVGKDDSGQRMEVVELNGHPFFVAAQFHPEFKSRPGRPSPLFLVLAWQSWPHWHEHDAQPIKHAVVLLLAVNLHEVTSCVLSVGVDLGIQRKLNNHLAGLPLSPEPPRIKVRKTTAGATASSASSYVTSPEPYRS